MSSDTDCALSNVTFVSASKACSSPRASSAACSTRLAIFSDLGSNLTLKGSGLLT